MRSPLLAADELDDINRSAEATVALRQAGIEALVELTPIGLGRDPHGLAEIAQRSSVRVVMATGVHREAHYPDDHWVHRTDTAAFATRFRRDIVLGCDATDPTAAAPASRRVRAGVIKVGAGYWSISPLERRVISAAAARQPRPRRRHRVPPRARHRRHRGARPARARMAYLPVRFVPRVRQAGGEELVRRILIDNPARLLVFPRRSPAADEHATE